MKRLSVLVFSVLFFWGVSVNAQEKKDNGEPTSFVAPSAVLSKIYTKEDLEKMGKLDLRSVYVEYFVIATEIIPYISLHTKPGATLKEMGIPETKANLEHLKKAVAAKRQYIEAVKVTLEDVIPYSDTKNIIWSILYFQDMITKAQQGEN
ncbi:MAG: hypothetical protein U0V72_01535 [Cytophagales bacterium]